MCTELLPPGGYPTAVNKYIISYIISYHKTAWLGNRNSTIKIVILGQKKEAFRTCSRCSSYSIYVQYLPVNETHWLTPLANIF
jgi:hypothetical protein